MSAQRFHEWPLAVFTTLAIVGAGLLTAPLVAALVGPSAAAASSLVLPGTALLAAGLAVSLAHLGQPQRAPLALARAGRSRLSNEIVLASGAVAAGAFASFFPYTSPLTTLLPSVVAIAFLVSLGLVYALPGQLAWQGATALSPFVLGIAFGCVGLAAAWDGEISNVAPVAAAALAADIVILLWRRRAPRTWLVRVLFVDILPAALLFARLPRGAAGMLGLGVLLDRLSFYLSARQHTTEREIANVEDVIARG